ncbi:MAG: AgmX/PglI C-terminal domain-containing protein [Fibrobacterota bacterium]|nr:MAG: AgmX/PglI C-terminal domain-containing protein [Fibrobacterota bacterium]
MEWLVPRSGGEPVLALGDQDPIRLTLPEAETYLSRDAFHSSSVLSADAKRNTSRSRTCRTLDTVLRVIRMHTGGFRYAFQKHLKANPELTSWVFPKLLISPNGKVTHVFFQGSSTGDLALDNELRHRMEKMEFPAVTACYSAYRWRLDL